MRINRRSIRMDNRIEPELVRVIEDIVARRIREELTYFGLSMCSGI